MSQNPQVDAWNGESGRAAPSASRAAAIAAAAEVMSQHVVDGRVVMGAATLVVTARAA